MDINTVEQAFTSLKTEIQLLKGENELLTEQRDRYRRLATQNVTRDQFQTYDEFVAWLEGGQS